MELLTQQMMLRILKSVDVRLEWVRQVYIRMLWVNAIIEKNNEVFCYKHWKTILWKSLLWNIYDNAQSILKFVSQFFLLSRTYNETRLEMSSVYK